MSIRIYIQENEETEDNLISMPGEYEDKWEAINAFLRIPGIEEGELRPGKPVYAAHIKDSETEETYCFLCTWETVGNNYWMRPFFPFTKYENRSIWAKLDYYMCELERQQ